MKKTTTACLVCTLLFASLLLVKAELDNQALDARNQTLIDISDGLAKEILWQRSTIRWDDKANDHLREKCSILLQEVEYRNQLLEEHNIGCNDAPPIHAKPGLCCLGPQ